MTTIDRSALVPHPYLTHLYWCGSEGEGDGGSGGSGDGGTGSGGDGGNSGEGGQGSGGAPPGTPPAGQQGDDKVSKAEYDALMARLAASDAAVSKANEKVKQFEDASKSELERAQEEAKTAKAEADKLRADLQSQQITNAFYASSKHTWHKPATALALLDRSTVTIGEDGTVKGMDAAIEKLVKSDPYLVKTGDGPPSGDGKDGKNGQGGGGQKLERDKLVNKYPALRR